MTYFRAFSGFVAALYRVATYRKKGKNGFLGCVDVGEKLQQTETNTKQTDKQQYTTQKHTTHTNENSKNRPKQPQISTINHYSRL